MSIKKQLQKFYAKQGLEGKHLRKAIQWDMKAARRNVMARSHAVNGCGRLGADLWAAFIWSATPEGGRYWMRRC